MTVRSLIHLLEKMPQDEEINIEISKVKYSKSTEIKEVFKEDDGTVCVLYNT